MKLYRLTILGYSGTIERGVWADWLKVADEIYYFMKDKEGTTSSEIVASYPVEKTIITNIETKEAYEERRKKESDDVVAMGVRKK